MKNAPKIFSSSFGLTILLAVACQAQFDSARFPIKPGNKWYFRCRESYSQNAPTYLVEKQIIYVAHDTAGVITTRSNPDSILGSELWIVRNGKFYIGPIQYPSKYDSSLTKDTSWYVVATGSVSYAYNLGRTTLFGFNAKYQALTYTYNDGFSTGTDYWQIAAGIGLFGLSTDHIGGEAIRTIRIYTLIALLLDGRFFGDSSLTRIANAKNPDLLQFTLNQNYPNPFNPSTTIQIDIPTSSPVILKVFNSIGQEVRTLINERLSVGRYAVNFNASVLPSGIYLYRLETTGQTLTRKMCVLK